MHNAFGWTVGQFLLVVMISTTILLLLMWLLAKTVRWARKGSAAASMVGWALMFLAPGLNPQPPPQIQVEDAGKQKYLKKTAESGDPE
jgi:hypothetical protein